MVENKSVIEHRIKIIPDNVAFDLLMKPKIKPANEGISENVIKAPPESDILAHIPVHSRPGIEATNPIIAKIIGELDLLFFDIYFKFK